MQRGQALQQRITLGREHQQHFTAILADSPEPAHLHCKVYVEGAEALTTQLHFEGDPFNEIDPWFSELTMLRTRVIAGDLVAVFDFSVV